MSPVSCQISTRRSWFASHVPILSQLTNQLLYPAPNQSAVSPTCLKGFLAGTDLRVTHTQKGALHLYDTSRGVTKQCQYLTTCLGNMLVILEKDEEKVDQSVTPKLLNTDTWTPPTKRVHLFIPLSYTRTLCILSVKIYKRKTFAFMSESHSKRFISFKF